MFFALPIVRTRALPPPAAPLRWHETGDRPAAVVVFVVALVGAGLGAGVALHAAPVAEGADRALALSAWLLLALCAVALVAALAEFTRVHTVSIDEGIVHRSVRELGRHVEHAEPLANYHGLLILDRTRRLFIRNRDRPLTGRRAPVTEFVIVLRHRLRDRRGRALDIELFRAQPSLETVLGMYRMQHSASSANAVACAELAARYRHALTQLCAQLDKPALIANAGNDPHELAANTLDDWLRPPLSEPPSSKPAHKQTPRGMK